MDLLKAQKISQEQIETIVEMRELMANYECAIYEVETKFKVLNKQLSLEGEANPIDSIKTRLKSPISIFNKLTRLNLPITPEAIEHHLNDIAGVRILCTFQEDIYKIADIFMAQDDVRVIEVKDYIAHPKPNGYRSLHIIVEVPIFLKSGKKMMRAEVQLRSIAMEFWANLEHRLRYKKDIPQEALNKTSDLLLECANISHELDIYMQEIKNYIDRSVEKKDAS